MVKKKAAKAASSKVKKTQEKIILYHNTRCTKSREACSILEKKKVHFDTVEYLKTPLNKEEIANLLKKLGLKAEELIRKKEPLFKEKFATKKFTESQWLKVMMEFPILIERPIIVKGNTAIIGRPPEKVLELL